MMRFRQRPVVIEAERFEGGRLSPKFNIILCHCDSGARRARTYPHIHTLQGVMAVDRGDWIIKGIEGEFYPIEAKIFEQTYEGLDDDDDTEN